jgi:hypothetical protein
MVSESKPAVCEGGVSGRANALLKVGFAEGFDEANQIAVMAEKRFASKTRQTLPRKRL